MRMKKTNVELLEFFGLKVGDRVKIEGYDISFVIFEECGIQYVEEMSKNWICNSKLYIIDFIHKLLGNNYEIITPKKKLGEMECDEMLCRKCPLRAIDCDAKSKTLYEAFENYRKHLNTYYVSLKPFEKTFIDAIKAELDKEVEECEK